MRCVLPLGVWSRISFSSPVCMKQTRGSACAGLYKAEVAPQLLNEHAGSVPTQVSGMRLKAKVDSSVNIMCLYKRWVHDVVTMLKGLDISFWNRQKHSHRKPHVWGRAGGHTANLCATGYWKNLSMSRLCSNTAKKRFYGFYAPCSILVHKFDNTIWRKL